MSTLVDSNVILDLTRDGAWTEWSRSNLLTEALKGPIVLNEIIYAEASSRFTLRDDFEDMIRLAGFTKEETSWEAAYLAGQAYVSYRRTGGSRERTLPDFLIGAHAAVKGYTLLTRDARRYRQFFPDLDLVAPDTHP